ncbi:battenin-like isoform X2 [Haliotis rufescens]|uniref:battenin-like isoform X2 n=1 Tax=Haliotis rufescens TaxID=6454 RepID=UPI001EAFF447|nr:battenin-like isoform X2 [Haliotis rufescens]
MVVERKSKYVLGPAVVEKIEVEEDNVADSPRQWRNLVGFWFLGLTNNFAYVVMLSAAHDILATEEEGGGNSTLVTTLAPENGTTPPSVNGSNNTDTFLECNKISTGAILLADILPTLVIKLTAPFYLQKIGYRVKVILVVAFALASFLLVALSKQIWLSILGVVCASISGGLGEITYLSLSTFFHCDVVSAWSSGTGGAGVFGALAYAGFTQVVSPRTTVLILTVVPVIMFISYFLVLKKPTPNDTPALETSTEQLITTQPVISLKGKAALVIPLLKYMIPLSLVYFAEYFINQGLHELLYFNNIWLSKSEQYRWYQVDYQIGVFISRSSVNCFEIRKLWILPILQFGNLAVLLTQIFYRYIPNIWIIIAIVFFEGLLGGGAYVNTFYRIRKEIAPEVREFSLGVATVGDAVGIAVAGAAAIPSHNRLCDLNLRM